MSVRRVCVLGCVVCWIAAIVVGFVEDGDRDLLWAIWGTVWYVAALVASVLEQPESRRRR